jgi:tol-pal system protein YbgF
MHSRRQVAVSFLLVCFLAAACASGRVARLEEQTAAVEERTAEVNRRLEGLERTKEELGRLDRESRALADARLSEVESRLATLEEIAREIEDRLSGMEEALRTGPTPVGMELEPEERDLYDGAYIDFARGEYEMALSGFEAFVERFPASSLADNATYWMGECHGALERWEDALAQYRLLRDRYPEGDKVKSSLLKEGMTLLELRRAAEGEAVMMELLQRFPHSEEARLAREKLAEVE